MSSNLMTKYGLTTTTLSVIAVIAIASLTGLNNAMAEEDSQYKVADNLQAVFTFTFKDGVEVETFPVFNMDANYVDKNINPGFSVEGVVGDSPLLHKALDEAFKYKANPSYEYDYQYFDVDVDFVKNGETMMTLPYHDCKVSDYSVKTLTASYESYMSSSSGFAVIDNIHFQCSGLTYQTGIENDSTRPNFTTVEYAHTPFKYAEDVRTFITFQFDKGIEVIEYPYFQTNGGFQEANKNIIPGFSVESTIKKHPLLTEAIENARSNGGKATGVNVDFEATVEAKQGDKVLRTLEYKDCRVTGSEIGTQTDKEEGFTGKSGFAYVEKIDFECIGLNTENAAYDALSESVPIWQTSLGEHNVGSFDYPLGTGPRAIATFTYPNGGEIVDFPIFDQGKVLVRSNPTFTLTGVVRDTPMLYKHTDDNLSLTRATGFTNFLDNFNVDVDLVLGDKVVRTFNYVDCRVTDYNVLTQRDKEESYFKGFVLTNSFDFECKGYHPNVPSYDQLFTNNEKAKTLNSQDLRSTQEWGPGFYVQ